MLTIADIPDEYQKGDTDGDNILRLASGVQEAILGALGEPGLEALKRFTQAAFLFRSSEIGRTMIRFSTDLSTPLRETPQFVDFGGGALAAAALAGAVDLTAATQCRLFIDQPFPRDADREADVTVFPGERQLPAAASVWLADTRKAPEWAVLKGLRDQYLHRWFPMHITQTLGAPNLLHEPVIQGVKRVLAEVLDEGRALQSTGSLPRGFLWTNTPEQLARLPERLLQAVGQPHPSSAGRVRRRSS